MHSSHHRTPGPPRSSTRRDRERGLVSPSGPPGPDQGPSPMERLLRALEEQGIRPQPIPQGIRAVCPNHRGDRENFEAIEVDTSRSLGSGGRLPVGSLLIHCHAYGNLPDGCTTQALVKALGLNLGDLYPRGSRVHRRPAATGSGRAVLPGWLEMPGQRQPSPEELERLAVEADRCAAALTPEALAELEARLQIPGEVLTRFGLGWRTGDVRSEWYGSAVGSCWTIPERDPQERVVGLQRRYRTGDKRQLPGGRRGLLLARGWREQPGPIYLPEGFTDTAALIAAGFCAVGRPSATGGLVDLIELLTPEHREIVVLGENDAHPAQGGRPARWPGRDGALTLQASLCQALGRDDIQVMLPPPEFKDIRAYLSASPQELR